MDLFCGLFDHLFSDLFGDFSISEDEIYVTQFIIGEVGQQFITGDIGAS